MPERPKEPYQGYPYVKPVVTDAVETNRTTPTLTKSNKDYKIPYQGFPYKNPIVTDAPSLNAAEVARLAKWQNLPRRPLCPPRDGGRSPESETSKESDKESGVSSISSPKPDLDPDRPVIYIDIPEGTSGVSERSPDLNDRTHLNGDPGRRPGPSGSKVDLDLDSPVVYIDIPQHNGSEVSQSIEEEEPSYVQETILYDQFKNRRIELPRDTDSESSMSPGSTASRLGASRPPLPNSLNFGASGSSGLGSTSTSIPMTYENKETSIYGQRATTNDEFSLSPLPVNDFPAYPPPYELIDSTTSPGTQTQTVVTEQPRTQVITPNIPPAHLVIQEDSKLVTCPHCSATVQTLVVLQNGFFTHVVAVLVCLFAMPLVIFVYCLGCFKYRHHYCPACNKEIGYLTPTFCSGDTNFVS